MHRSPMNGSVAYNIPTVTHVIGHIVIRIRSTDATNDLLFSVQNGKCGQRNKTDEWTSPNSPHRDFSVYTTQTFMNYYYRKDAE